MPFRQTILPSRKTGHRRRHVAEARGWARIRAWWARLLGRAEGPEAGADSMQTAGPATTSAAATQMGRLQADELSQLRRDLRQVLDQHADSRRVMRYLRALEHALHHKGRRALEELPVELLRRALEQLDLLGADRERPGLATLRSKAAFSIAERERLASERSRRRVAPEHDVQVEDASHSRFLEAHEEWERSLTGQATATVSAESDVPKS